MANDTSKVKFRKRWPVKWGLRLFVVLGLLALLPVLTYLIAPDFTNGLTKDFVSWRMSSQLDDIAEQRPEVADAETLVLENVTGSNGIVLLEVAEEAWESASRSDSSDNYSIGDSHGENRHDHILMEISDIPDYAETELALSQPIADAAVAAIGCDNIVPHIIYGFHTAPNVLTGRVVLLDVVGNVSQRDAELLVLLELLNCFEEKRYRRQLHHFLLDRNSIIEEVVIPILKSGNASSATKGRIYELRWHTLGNDPILWRNNLAMFGYALKLGLEKYDSGGELSFFEENARTPGQVVTTWYSFSAMLENAQDLADMADSGELDLRNKTWVKKYHDKFDYDALPINWMMGFVVG
ncbi:MAG: hypothetical protein L3J82_10660 [Planctomycetes bacterium]|nr:hypothetical protein [Planctomycetota bacterium]